MCITNSNLVSISHDLELPPKFPHEKLKWNGQWSKKLATFPGTDNQPSNQLEVWTLRPNKQLGLGGLPVDKLLNVLFPSLGHRGIKARHQALQCTVLASTQALCSLKRPNRVNGFISPTNTTQPAAVKRYKQCDFSDQVLAKVLTQLMTIGFLKVHKGFKNGDYPKGVTTLWIPTRQFYNWLSQHLDNLVVTTFRDDIEPLILRDNNKTLMDYTDTPDTHAMRERLVAANALRTAHTWTYHPIEEDRETKDGWQFKEGLQCIQIPSHWLVCRRIFKGDFETGGRFTCKAQQELRKVQRETIYIDNEPTIELDFKSMQPRMIYHLKGLEAPEDCYTSTLMDRVTAKQVSLICLNAKDLKEAMGAVRLKCKVSTEDAHKYIESFSQRHSAIADWFFSSSWGRLQHLESQITDSALHQATQKGIPVLPIHDSYITKTRYVIDLRDILKDTYRKYLQADPVLSW